jgi:hypothetical protein
VTAGLEAWKQRCSCISSDPFFLNPCLVATVYRRPLKEDTAIPRLQNRTQKSPLGASVHYTLLDNPNDRIYRLRPRFW